jgi:hypothetical protein
MTARKLAAAAISAIAIGASAGPSAAHAAQCEGTVTAKDKQARTFTLRQDEAGGTFKIKVTKATRYERLSGFADIVLGAKNIDVTARKAKGRWVAIEVARSGKAGGDDG